MDSSDILIIAGCGLVGFGAVHMFLRKPPALPEPPPTPSAPPVQPPSEPHWTRVLELPPDASLEQIRDAYRRLISQYHPDKVASLGRELQELAEAKSKDIALAYQAALMERGNA
jgi:hypothetical protein